MTFLLCKVIYRCKKADFPGRASAFEIFISSNCQRLLYSKGQKFHSINKASNGTRSYGEIAIKGSTEPIISRIFRFQQPLQNRVPRVQVLLPLPSKNGLNTAFKPFFHIILFTEHGLIFPFWRSFQASKWSTGANNSNVSVCYIIKIASVYSYLFSVTHCWTVFSTVLKSTVPL